MLKLLPSVRSLAPVFLFTAALACQLCGEAEAGISARPSEISGGAEANRMAVRVPSGIPFQQDEETVGVTGTAAFTPGIGFTSYDFDDNPAETGGFVFIPPDPIGAAGPDRVIAVVNVGIEARDKTGTLIFKDSLKDFFSPLGGSTLGTFTFDPKIVYDHYEDRFVVVTLEQTEVAAGDPSDESRILIAVSKTSSPATATAADWYYHAIDSKISIGGFPHWADYPGFEIDEEVVYITNNMFPFGAGGGGVRLWIVDKGAVGGFYGGGAATVTVHDPIPAGFFALTTQPALVFGAGGVGPGIGTFLVGYNSLTFGGPGGLEAVQVIRVDNPTGAVSFSGEFVTIGDVEDVGGVFGFPALPDAPQSGTATLIEVNDSRALDAVWRNDALWMTTTVNPNAAFDAPNVGQATAHWIKMNTSAVPGGAITLDQNGDIGGEDIASNTWTFFPAVAVNGLGEAKFGFSASASTIFGGAYYAGRQPGDPAGTVQASGVVQAGLDFYIRIFAASGGTRNRWGDYSGIAVDPADDQTFWVFNEYADLRGTPIGGEDGRWGTAWRSCSSAVPPCVNLSCAPDQNVTRGDVLNLDYIIENCGTSTITFDGSITDSQGWCTPINITGASVLAGNAQLRNLTCTIPNICPPASTVITYEVTLSTGEQFSCSTTLTVVNTPPVAVCQNVSVIGGAPGCSVAVAPAAVDNGSSDPDGDPFTLQLLPPGPFPEGVTNVQLIVDDGCDADTCAATVTVTCPVGPMLDVTPADIFFVSVPFQQKICDTVTVRNTGDQPLDINSISGCDTGDFSLDFTGTAFNIASGDSTKFAVCFTAITGASDSCTVTIDTNAGIALVPAVVQNVTAVGDDLGFRALALSPVLPNPFSSSAIIRFTLPEESPVRLEIFDSQGRRVRALFSGSRPEGTHEVVWDGNDDGGRESARGVYFVKLVTALGQRTVRAVRVQ